MYRPYKKLAKLPTNTAYITILSLFFVCAPSLMGQRSTLSPTKDALNTTFLGDLKGVNYGVMIGNDSLFDRPVYILEGFDPFNETDYGSIYNHWRKSPIIDSLYCAGYDIITVDFNDNHCNVLQNAAYIKQLIQHVNTLKQGTQKSILAGESMGGIIGRVALAEMEGDNADHQVRLFLALDSPFKGANVPVGIQYLLSDIEKLDRKIINKAFEKETGYSISTITKTMHSMAAQQLIRFHIADSSTYHFKAFQQHLDAIGYPKQCRNITLVNGSNQAKPYPFDTGSLYFSLQKGWAPILKIEAQCYTTAVNDSTQLVSSLKDYNLWHMRKGRKHFEHHISTPAHSYDRAPGGYLVHLDFSSTGIHHFCFVPSASAIDLRQDLWDSPEGLLYLNTNKRSVATIIAEKASPFDAIYCNASNDKHAKIYLIPQLKALIENELLIDTCNQ